MVSYTVLCLFHTLINLTSKRWVGKFKFSGDIQQELCQPTSRLLNLWAWVARWWGSYQVYTTVNHPGHVCQQFTHCNSNHWLYLLMSGGGEKCWRSWSSQPVDWLCFSLMVPPMFKLLVQSFATHPYLYVLPQRREYLVFVFQWSLQTQTHTGLCYILLLFFNFEITNIIAGTCCQVLQNL